MRTNKHISKKFRRGSLLAFVLVIGICLALLGSAMLHLGYGSRLNAAFSTFAINARIAADAGLTNALYQMNLNYKYGAPWPSSSGTVILDNSDASYSFAVSKLDDVHYRIDSTGAFDREIRTVHAFTGRQSLFDYALFVTNYITLRNGATIDGYDSGIASYSDTNPKLPVEIGSNTTKPRQGSGDEGIFLISDVDMNGNVAVGPGLSPEEIWGQGSLKGVIDGDPGAISGSAYSLLEPYIWADVAALLQKVVNDGGGYQDVLSTDTRYGGAGVIGTIGTPPNPDVLIGKQIISTGQIVECKNLNITNSGVLEVYGNVVLHVTGNVDLGNAAQIFVTAGSSLRIFLDGIFTSDNSCLLTNANTISNPQPKFLSIYGTSTADQTWNVQYGGDFYGTIYAPNVNVIVKNSGDIFGSIAAKSFRLDSSGNVHYDLSLGKEAEFFTGYTIHRWWED